MRMTSAKMRQLARYAKFYGIGNAANMLFMRGYSFHDSRQICRDAVIKAIKWSKSNDK